MIKYNKENSKMIEYRKVQEGSLVLQSEPLVRRQVHMQLSVLAMTCHELAMSSN